MFSDKLQLSLVNNTLIKNAIDESHFAQGQAGFVKNGKLAWIIRDAVLEILSTSNGLKIAHFNFGKRHGAQGCFITCVEEIDYLPGVCLLAVATEFSSGGASTGVLSIFCVHGSKIIGSTDFCERITSCCFINEMACQKSVLRNFHGTLAVGTDQGKLFLIDLMIPESAKEIASSQCYDTELFPCINILANVEQSKIAETHLNTTASDQQLAEKAFFSIQLDVLNDTGAVVSILCMPNLFTLAVGLNDGRLVLYDLVELHAFHLAHPPSNRAPLTHMSYLEPTDDPRCAVYIWAFHTSNDGAIAVMHSLMFANKINKVYEDFKSCSVRLTMPMYVKDTFPICCRSIMRTLTLDDEDVITLNVFAWTSPSTKKTNVMIFDLNQWYKEEMPHSGDWRMQLKFAAVFELQNCASLDIIIHEHSVFPFNSILRPEEHFHPNSLSFDVCVLENDKFSHHRWFGLQNIVLQQFNVIGPQIILEPNYYFKELLQVAIVPQFSDAVFNVATPIGQKREFLMSVALEYNFNGFLKKCAWAWADGSYLGKDDSSGIGLSTLTDWIWNRAHAIKEVCNSLCQPLFDYSEQRIDYGTQKQLSQCSKQLKVLSDLLTLVLREYHKHIPDHIIEQLKSQSEIIKMASDYQEVLQWLLNVGLLPEGIYVHDQQDNVIDEDFVIVPYPYRAINSYYEAQRAKLMNTDDWMGENQLEEDTSKFMFIDAFIERECNSEKVYEVWNGVYPPKSIQALLRTLLVPEIPLESKHVIFVYLFMDITNILGDGAYSSIVRNLIKFPAVFKMNPAMIKRTQAFWNLDNGRLNTSVEELISPLSHDLNLPVWQRELLIGALLKQNSSNLAMRALRCPGSDISSELEMLTLLSNNLISEALKVQRSSGDKRLLEKLFEKILHSPSYEQLLDLTLTEEEGVVLGTYLENLKNTGLPNHLNIHFVFLLQRNKFLEAADLVESLGDDDTMNLEPAKQVLNAYYASMESTTRKLTSMVHKKNVQAQEPLVPLSVSLIKSKYNAKTDIYQKCVQSIAETACDNTQDIQKLPFIGTPKLGIFEYRQPTVNYQDFTFATEVNEHGKRKQLQKKDQSIRLEDFEAPKLKKRRLDDQVVGKRKSYMDTTLTNLTVFKETKPNFNFVKRNLDNSNRSTPERRVQTFGNFLSTPIVQKKATPGKFMDKCPPTPHSILKTRSRCGSVSPAPSRFSEFDDNKSVKSITFAALPDSRDNSFDKMSHLEESFNEEGQIETSTEDFFSPGKFPEVGTLPKTSLSPLEGPKPRKGIKSRSVTPVGPIQGREKETSVVGNKESGDVMMEIEEVPSTQELTSTQELFSAQESRGLDESDASCGDEEYDKPFRDGSVLKDDVSSSNSDGESDESIPEKSIYHYKRKSALSDNYGEFSDSSDEETQEKPATKSETSEHSEEVEDEHYEEEELPEHSEYDDSSNENGDKFEYGDVDLEDTEESSSFDTRNKAQQASKKANTNEVICLDSSSDEEVEEQKPTTLPSFTVLGNVEVTSEYAENVGRAPSEEMFTAIYDDLDDPMEIEIQEEIESPPYEAITSTVCNEATSSQPLSSVEVLKVLDALPVETELVEAHSTQTAEEERCLVPVDEVQIEPREVEVAEEPSSSMEVELQAAQQNNPEEALKQQEAEAIPAVVETSGSTEQTAQNEITNASEMTEEMSFVSASGEAMNEAAIVSQSISEISNILAPSSDHVSSALSMREEEVAEENEGDMALVEDPIDYSISEDISNIIASPQRLIATTNDKASLQELKEEKVEAPETEELGSSNSVEKINILDQAQIIETSVDTSEKIDEIEQDQESVDEMNTALVQEASVADTTERASPSPTTSRRRTRQSISVEKSIEQGRISRAQSMPSSGGSSPRSRSSRAATEDRERSKPHKLKLQVIEEILTPVSSPGVLTRRRSQLLEAGESTPQTPTRITRRLSQLSEDGANSNPTTPRRLTRASSKEGSLHSESEKTPEDGKLTRQPSKRSVKRAPSAESDDAKSTRSTRSLRKKSEPLSASKLTPEKAESIEPTEELSVSNRRLTRQQLQVVEKSRQLSLQIASSSALRATKSATITNPRVKTEDSDNESVTSDSASVASSKTSNRKRKTPKKAQKDDDGTSSVASKSSKASNKRGKLSVIPEESQEDSSIASSSRSRKKT